MKITTRKPLRNEKEFVRRIHHAGYHDVVVAQFGTWDETRQDSFFEKKWSNSHLQILVVDNESCGFATVEENEQEVCLVELVVHPEFQGQGIGTAYLVRLIDQAEKRAVPPTSAGSASQPGGRTLPSFGIPGLWENRNASTDGAR